MQHPDVGPNGLNSVRVQYCLSIFARPDSVSVCSRTCDDMRLIQNQGRKLLCNSQNLLNLNFRLNGAANKNRSLNGEKTQIKIRIESTCQKAELTHTRSVTARSNM